MKKNLIVLCLIFFITGFAIAQYGPGKTLYVRVNTVQLKSSAGRGSNVATLNYADVVTAIRTEGKFVEVRSADNASLIGWTASENFSTRRIIPGNATSVTAGEVALAGKGFNQEVEDTYKAQGELNYTDVDRVETIVADEAELMRFIRNGRLTAGE